MAAVPDLQLFIAHFLFIRINGETRGNKHFLSQKNDGIFHNFDKVKVSKVPL